MKILHRLFVLVIVALSLHSAAGGLTSYELARYHGWTQTSSNTFELETWSGGVFLEGSIDNFVAGYVRFPNGTEERLFEYGNGYGLGSFYDNQQLLDADWPNGSYVVRLERENALPIGLPMVLQATRAALPQVLNYGEIVNWDAGKEKTVRFQPFAGASGADRLLVMLVDTTEGFQPIRTNTVSTRFSSVSIPANVLVRNRQYQLIVDFQKVFDVGTNTVTGAVGSAFNSSFVTINFTATGGIVAPRITRDLQDVATVEGSPFTMAIQATGDELAYTWRVNGEPQAYSTASVSTHGADYLAGDWQVVVSNSAGSATSRVARVTVRSARPTIFQQPVSASVAFGELVVLSVGAEGPPGAALTFQWNRNGQWIGSRSASNNVLRIPIATVADSGSYFVKVWSTNDFSVESERVEVTVAPPALKLRISLNASLLPAIELTPFVPGNYSVEVSHDLVNWSPWTNVTSPDGLISLVDTSAGAGVRFYRAKGSLAPTPSPLAGRAIRLLYAPFGSEELTFAPSGNTFTSDLPAVGEWRSTVRPEGIELSADFTSPALFANDIMNLTLRPDQTFSGTAIFHGENMSLSGTWQYID